MSRALFTEHHLHRSSLLLLCPDRSLDALQPVNKTLFSEIKLVFARDHQIYGQA
jgi:hypothetical protein